MNIKLQTEPTFRTICMMGRDEAKSLVNIFDCMMSDEDGYGDLERILDYRIDNLLANVEQIKKELENYIAKKREQLFTARLEEIAVRRIRFSKLDSAGE